MKLMKKSLILLLSTFASAAEAKDPNPSKNTMSKSSGGTTIRFLKKVPKKKKPEKPTPIVSITMLRI